eukprot:TRINITY_DN10327_c0_g1_i3.p1 TRINITY_DN10327_c0_g1~~TRINITY_DN10327_c0_g1_i3.p1  ORF type:complete len:102 (+),score=34.92 TRINITY_DN10327_c0_g1_i3:79-384(+)
MCIRDREEIDELVANNDKFASDNETKNEECKKLQDELLNLYNVVDKLQNELEEKNKENDSLEDANKARDKKCKLLEGEVDKLSDRINNLTCLLYTSPSPRD